MTALKMTRGKNQGREGRKKSLNGTRVMVQDVGNTVVFGMTNDESGGKRRKFGARRKRRGTEVVKVVDAFSNRRSDKYRCCDPI